MAKDSIDKKVRESYHINWALAEAEIRTAPPKWARFIPPFAYRPPYVTPENPFGILKSRTRYNK